MIPGLPPLSLTGGAGGNAGPSTATGLGGTVGSLFDASGWTVSTGSARSTGAGNNYALYALIAGGVLIAGLLLWKKH